MRARTREEGAGEHACSGLKADICQQRAARACPRTSNTRKLHTRRHRDTWPWTCCVRHTRGSSIRRGSENTSMHEQNEEEEDECDPTYTGSDPTYTHTYTHTSSVRTRYRPSMTPHQREGERVGTRIFASLLIRGRLLLKQRHERRCCHRRPLLHARRRAPRPRHAPPAPPCASRERAL